MKRRCRHTGRAESQLLGTRHTVNEQEKGVLEPIERNQLFLRNCFQRTHKSNKVGLYFLSSPKNTTELFDHVRMIDET